MSRTVFIEGGGTGKDLRARCREGFRDFLGRLALTGRHPRMVACGTRADAFKRFTIAKREDPGGAYALLVDSEEVVNPGQSAWDHVAERSGDGWTRPDAARDDDLHFMAVCMESWIAADAPSLSRFYGRGFQADQLPRQETDIESIDRRSIHNHLRAATRGTKKGEYAKGKASFAALGAVDINVVSQRLSFCDRFVKLLIA